MFKLTFNFFIAYEDFVIEFSLDFFRIWAVNQSIVDRTDDSKLCITQSYLMQ
jgi:hypothetical protein